MLKRLITVAAVLLVLLPGVGSADIARTAAATPPALTVTASATTVAAGGTITVTCSNFIPQEVVVLRLSGVGHLVATGRVAASGTALVPVVIPATAAAGRHTLTVLGLRSQRLVTISILVQPATGTPAPQVHPLAFTGQLTGMNGSLLTVAVGAQTYTVEVSSSTTIVRLYNGPSALDELSPGDRLVITGTFVTPNTVAATWIKDTSIQRAWTRLSGKVIAVAGTSLPASVLVTAVRDRLSAPFTVGQNILVTVGATTQVIAPAATGTAVQTGTTAVATLAASTGKVVTVLGTYDRVHQSFTAVYRLVIHRS
jgi:hypothetical protein